MIDPSIKSQVQTRMKSFGRLVTIIIAGEAILFILAAMPAIGFYVQSPVNKGLLIISFFPLIWLTLLFLSRYLKCPVCEKPMGRMKTGRCDSCGAILQENKLSTEAQVMESWQIPPELNVSKPRNLSISGSGVGATLIRWFVIGLMLFFMVAGFVYPTLKFTAIERQGLWTEGTVIDVSQDRFSTHRNRKREGSSITIGETTLRTGRKTYWKARISFPLQNGNTFDTTVSTNKLKWEKGSTIHVRYVPNHPSWFTVAEMGNPFSLTGRIIVGVVCFGFLLAVVFVVRHRTKLTHLLKNGDAIPGIIENIQPGGKHSDWLKVKYQYNGSNQNILVAWNRKTRREVGDVVTLLVDPAKPGSADLYPENFV
jgi:hypothetical protein